MTPGTHGERVFTKLAVCRRSDKSSHRWAKRARSASRCRTTASAGSENGAPGSLTGDLKTAVRDAKDHKKWARAIVVENKAESADGQMRTLVLSVEDHVNYLDGRRMRRRQEGPRWVDAYKVPGQFVGVRYPPDPISDSASGSIDAGDAPSSNAQAAAAAAESSGDPPGDPPTARTLFAISSSPYSARRDSANLDASIIELLVHRDGCEDNRRLASLGPGSLIEVSEVMGRGFASLFNSYVGLLSGLEDARNLLLIGAGCRGIAPLRAAIEWTPVQAHSTAHRVTLFYFAPSALSAAYLKDWDSWREAGVQVNPVYLESSNGSAAPSIWEAVKGAVLGGQQGLMGAVGGDPRDCTVLVAGLPGDAAAALSRALTAEGVAGERILFCDFF
ncbi:g9280 [Coccomyxa elongata]